MKICLIFYGVCSSMYQKIRQELTIFDNYFEQSVKQHERDRRRSDQAIEMKIANACQKLPIEMENFWSSSNKKIQLQLMFIDWFISTSSYHIPVYLGKWFVFI